MAPINQFSDIALATLLKGKDHAAFTEIYNRYKGLLYVHALKMLKDDQHAEDLIHDLFSALWNRAEAYNLEVPISKYLYRGTRNRVLDTITHQNIKTSYLESLQQTIESGKYITDELIREKELANAIETEIARLPRKMREVFELSRKNHLSHQQIADELGISSSTVKKQVANALKILKGKINSSLFKLFFLG
jgi:RNA polymerase sigma-70 factor (family 1)